jgi:hypothetical protein
MNQRFIMFPRKGIYYCEDTAIAYQRCKTGVTSLISFGEEVAAILRTLPEVGQLFPALARIHERHRAKLFIKRLATVNVSGVSLHSYRYRRCFDASASR